MYNWCCSSGLHPEIFVCFRSHVTIIKNLDYVLTIINVLNISVDTTNSTFVLQKSRKPILKAKMPTITHGCLEIPKILITAHLKAIKRSSVEYANLGYTNIREYS